MYLKMKYFNSLLVLLAFCAVKVDSLECYECEGETCNNIKSEMTVNCEQVTPQPPTSTTDDSTQSTTGETGSSSTDTPESTTGTDTQTAEPTTVAEARFARSLTDDYYIKPADLLIQNYNSRADLSYSCYSANRDASKRKHGCIGHEAGTDACTAVKKEYDITLSIADMKCRACTSEKCNGSASLGLSIVVLLSSVLMYKLLN